MDQTFQRHCAIKVSIKELVDGTYVTEQENNPNYLRTAAGQILYRVNVVGIILEKKEQGSITTFTLDDGTGTIAARCFEENKNVNVLKIGEAVLLIGKVRMYNQEKYLSPEIIRKISSSWLKVRALEIKKNMENSTPISSPLEEGVIEKENRELPLEKLTKLIKELDQGGGAMIEEVISKSHVEGAERWIELMLEKGEIFQNLPGKIKIL